ncbi:hypothetical protein BJ508DRAFT_336977 [Ascobolus immersus RN42]|uniref:Uncharacterized protein n=1 Tax=Ascobolus immersus RN42 TaxID=1160509 RepID=A0A3N4HDR7_ASCIM|nr:hypothetical protein BJ508DRAFT_336977 [Ascobolus immersus RN42]
MTYGFEPDKGTLLQGKVEKRFTLETFLEALQDSLRKIRPTRANDPSVKRIWLYTGQFGDNQFPEEPYTKVEITSEYNFYQRVTEFKGFLVSRTEGYLFRVEFHRTGLPPVDQSHPRDLPLLRYTTFRSYSTHSAIKLASDNDRNHQFALSSDDWIARGYPPRHFTLPGEAPCPAPVDSQVTSASEPDTDEDPASYRAHQQRWTAETAWKISRDLRSFTAPHPEHWRGDEEGLQEVVRAGTFARLSEAEKEEMRTGNWDALPEAEKERLRLTRFDILPQAEKDAMIENHDRFYDLPLDSQQALYDLGDHDRHLPGNERDNIRDFNALSDAQKEQVRSNTSVVTWGTLPFYEKERMINAHWDRLPEGIKNFYRLRGRVPVGQV